MAKSSSKWNMTMTRRKKKTPKPEKVKPVPVASLVDRSAKQSNTFEINGLIQLLSDRKLCYIGSHQVLRADLEALGYTVKRGAYVRVLAQISLAGNSTGIRIVERLDDDLRSLSDMRTKPAWRALPWLELAIAAIYAERDRLTRETGIEHHVDHVRPVAGFLECGLTVPWNLQVIPAVENLRKGNRIVD